MTHIDLKNCSKLQGKIEHFKVPPGIKELDFSHTKLAGSLSGEKRRTEENGRERKENRIHDFATDVGSLYIIAPSYSFISVLRR
jgi:hypothetical protein